MHIDIRTLFVLAVTAEFVRAVLLALTWAQRRAEPALAYWSAASFSMALGYAGISLRDAVPIWVTIGIAHFFVYFGLGLRWIGLRSFAGQPVQLTWALWPPLLLCLIMLLHQPLGLDVNLRGALSAGLSLVFMLLMLRDIRRAQQTERLVMRRLVFVVIGLLMALELLRCLQAAQGGLSPTFYMASNEVHGLLLLGLFILYVLLDIACFMMQFERHETRLLRAATLDALTSLLNRAGFKQLADRQLQRSAREGRPVSVLVMDLDFFKRVNDTYGHEAGDAVLCAFAQSARTTLRPTDLLGRAGGEEFWALLPNADLDEACRIAQRVCDQFRAVRVAFDEHRIAATVSIGVAELKLANESVQAALARADQALYTAKHLGRDRVSGAHARLAEAIAT